MAVNPTITLHTGDHQLNLRLAVEFLGSHPDVKFIHYHWADLSGVLRVRILPTDHSLRLIRQHRPLQAGAFSLIGFAQGPSLPRNFRPGGVNGLWPDWSSLRLLKHGHASVLCNVSEEASGHTDVNPSAPFLRCPRSMLQSLLNKVESELRVSLLVGFEMEFHLMDEKDRQQALTGDGPAGYNYWSSASAMRDSRGKCLGECVEALQAADIYVEQFHAESARNSYEIATGPLSVLSAVDTWNQSLEIVKQTAVQHGFQATFLPKPFARLYCLGQHVHLSVHVDECDSDEKVQEIQESFLAGILRRLPLLCGYGMPSRDSFKRHGLAFSGWVTRGTQNRGAPIREIDKGHWELKTIDGTANFYLVLATFIAAGVLGVQESEALVWRDNRDFLANLDGAEMKQLQLETQLPATLKEALHLCASNHMGLDVLLGPQLLDFFTAVKKGEEKCLENMTDMEQKIMYLENF
ncbi:glutamine synthetase/guanido kinase [Lindgomyces ingoldianus]|uniref:Glutamine synthetase/guanido kinase n=1 Tax=Lindgomyces ingoldianus TaxID=673940 RepID=A0ACB6R9N2_9PLEO|nr:glutamine synthetase/guanido kinase [Lindgomyces ingoldianus]KAF2476028.1 glutamine synthetase/guanido kinase [Lindgomyces ingoldianus]